MPSASFRVRCCWPSWRAAVAEYRASAQVPTGHPCLAGHFPGNPVVPAVVLLQLVLDAARSWRGSQWQFRRLLAAKFLQPLRPDERFEILLQMKDGRLDFRCEREARLLAQGSWEMGGHTEAMHVLLAPPGALS